MPRLPLPRRRTAAHGRPLSTRVDRPPGPRRRVRRGRADAHGHWLFGLRYGKIEFSRFSGELTAAAADVGIDANDFELGTVMENVWDLAALAGFERTTLFVYALPSVGVSWSF